MDTEADDLGLVDEEIANEVMLTLMAAYPSFEKGMGERRHRLYTSRMIGLDAAVLLAVVEEWIDEKPWPPSPAELRQPTLARVRRMELDAWLEEAQARRFTRRDIPGGDEVLACGLTASAVLTETKRCYAHTFFGGVRLVQFDPKRRIMTLDHPRPRELDWWQDTTLSGQIVNALHHIAGEAVQVAFAPIVA